MAEVFDRVVETLIDTLGEPEAELLGTFSTADDTQILDISFNVMISYAVCSLVILQVISEGMQHRLYTNSMVMNSQNIIR